MPWADPIGRLQMTLTPSTLQTTHSLRTRRLATAALLAALLAASAWITVPLPSVPLTLQVFVVVLIALILPPGWAAASVGTYLLLGAIGVPVYAGPRGGLGVLAGPTGGFLLGFFVGATTGAALRLLLDRHGARELVADAAAAVVVLAATYLIGWARLAEVTGMNAVAAFAAGVAPFVVADVAKAAVAIAIVRPLRRAGLTR
jgi:biotin transport system substrate-specific component